MHRRLAYLLAWAVAATITVGISWLGIRSVLAAAAPTQTVPLSAVQLHGTSPQIPANGANPSAIATPPVADGTGRGPGTQSGSWSPDGQGFARTFHTVGGDVEVFTTQGSVQVASNTPKPGYTANVTRYAPDSVMVSFFGDRKVSRVWVRWWNGPYAEITESVD